jgi:REP element-mobilizing transposase RayT
MTPGHPPPPDADHLTLRTYGTWLPGDDRGWRRHGDTGPARPPSPALRAWCERQTVAPPLYQTAPQRRIVEAAVRETCAHRGYMIHALAVQRSHVHVVLRAARAHEFVMADLKRWATRALRRDGLPREQPVWADHGSTRYLLSPQRRGRAERYAHDDHHRPAPLRR